MIDKEDFKSGFISIIDRPNVGKSTLLNALLGEKIAIISNKLGQNCLPFSKNT